MFDVSFGELLLILIVGLLVFGPEKLPQVVRTASQWIAHFRRSFNQIRADIEREVGVDEFKRDLHNQTIMDSLRDVKKDLQGTQQQIDQLPYAVNDSVRENFRRELQPEHAIPNNDLQPMDVQASAPADDDALNSRVQPGTRTATESPAISRASDNPDTASARRPHHSD